MFPQTSHVAGRLFCLAVFFVFYNLASGLAVEPTWKAGVAKEIITPKTDIWLAGYGSKRVATEKIHELWVKALALEDTKGNRVVLITSDFQGLPKMMSDVVFANVLKKHQLKRHQILFTFSHNHCGPRLGDDLIDYYPVEKEQEKKIAVYTSRMVKLAVKLVGDALKDMQPAQLHLGNGHTTFAVNRRNNREADVPDLIAKGKPLVGPFDHNVPVMTVSRPNGKLAAVLFGYCCHPTTLSFKKWCGDYPGYAQIEIEKKHPGAIAMFVNTCGGDQNPLPRRKVKLCEKYGHMLAMAVEDAMQKPLKKISPRLKSAFEYVELAYVKVVDKKDLEKATNSINRIEARWAKRLLVQLEKEKQFASTYPYPVHAWQLGDEMLVIGMGAETVVDYSLRFKRKFGAGTWVCGYADDMIAYIPSRRVWEEGGYEGGARLYEYGRPAYRWAGDIEKRIVKTVHQLVKQVK